MGAIFTACIMMSVVTAVPQSNSEPVMNVIHEVEEGKLFIDEKVSEISSLDPQSGGLIDFLKKLVWMIIQAILDLIDIIKNLIGLVALIEYLIELVMVLVDAVIALIELIMNIFNPSASIS